MWVVVLIERLLTPPLSDRMSCGIVAKQLDVIAKCLSWRVCGKVELALELGWGTGWI
jgi:hypothetical protein